jgi:haloalkane dehalogenase
MTKPDRNILRTPEECFGDLPGFDFEPRYVSDLPSFDGLRVHYVDEGPREANDVVLCLHGQPTWSYLYRKMIPVFADARARVLAPDMFGFGRTDKPMDEAFYTFESHRTMLLEFVARLDLANITLVVQDWGGLLGLTLPMNLAGRVSKLVVMNTVLATGDGPLTEGFFAWRNYSNAHPDMDIGALMRRAVPILSDSEARAYAAPFPDATYKAGVRRFPNLVPDRWDAPGAELSRQARAWLREHWTGQSIMAIGMKDPVLGPVVMNALHEHIRGCSAALELPQAGHFVQEWGEVVAAAAVKQFRYQA